MDPGCRVILGVGMDIVDVSTFRQQLADGASAFVERAFRPRERRDCREAGSGDETLRLAARYAAKEAFIKAFDGAGWGQAPRIAEAPLGDIEVVRDAWGRPRLQLHGTIAEAFAALGSAHAHLSISHDGGYAAATVVISDVSGATHNTDSDT